MPLGKYFCDYCEKQFQDTPFARKRHLESAQHQRARALWYADISNSRSGANICNNFIRTGFCQFGDGCRYFHPNQNMKNEKQVVLGNMSGDLVRASWGILPPSLRPPPEGGYSQVSFIDWG